MVPLTSSLLSNSESQVLHLLRQYPDLKNRMTALLLLIEEEQTADNIEEHVIELVRNTGRETLQAWATHQNQFQSEQALTRDSQLKKAGKKNCVGTPRSAPSP